MTHVPTPGAQGSVLLLTDAASAEALPALGLLPHQVSVAALDSSALACAPACDAVLVDGRRDLARAREVCRLIAATGIRGALLAVVTEGGLTAVSASWAVDDVLLDSAGPAEVQARMRLARERLAEATGPETAGQTKAGELTIDDGTYTARLHGTPLDLTFREFELLRYLAQHPGRVFTRAELLREVWGYDYFGGSRTVDVHVRRLRAKLGAEHEALLGTVRGVGYRFVPPDTPTGGRRSASPAQTAGHAG